MSQWQYLTPYNIGQPGSVNLVGARDILDARRSMPGAHTPSAEYPDGYLGTIIDRREDRLLKSVQSRLTQRSYQRGVHKGERVDPQDYYWSDEVNPQKALEYQARGLKWTQRGNQVERLAHLGKTGVSSPGEMAEIYRKYGVDPQVREEIDPIRQERMRKLLPNRR